MFDTDNAPAAVTLTATASTGSSPTDRRGLRVLTLDECLQRAATAPLGRVAFAHDGEIVILPVNHAIDRMDVVFRTGWGSKREVAVAGGRVAFEVDSHDAERRVGWSVLIKGSAALVYDADERRRLDALGMLSWVATGGNDGFWVRLRAEEITGREIVSI